MDKIEFLNREINKFINNGCDSDDIESLKPVIISDFLKLDDSNPDRIIREISEDIIKESQKFLDSKNEEGEQLLSGLSTCIYLPDIKNEGYKLTFLGGENNNGGKIDSNTKFDIASITKMFTLLLTFKFVEYGYFDLNDKIADLDIKYSGLEDFTIYDILKLCGELYTVGNPKEGKTVEEANNILDTIYLKNNDRTRNLYTDLGAIVLSKVIEKIVSEHEGKNISYNQIMNKYILEPYNLNMTEFNPINNNLAGNGNKNGYVHDPKSRALGGAVGSAGLFTTSEDLSLLAREMYIVSDVNYDFMKNLVSKENLLKMGTVTFPDAKQNHKGLLGLYQKNLDRENKWLSPLTYGDNSFTAQGFTGAVSIFDAKNRIHNNFLLNAIGDEKSVKTNGFMQAFKKYEYYIVGKTMELSLIKKYYDELIENNSIVATKRVK